MKNPESRQASSGPNQYSFLPEPEFNPIFPSPQSLAYRALSRMLQGERLTQPRFGTHCWRLAAYIKDLDYMNWPIERADVPCPPGFGTGRPIREYWLSHETIQRAKALTEEAKILQNPYARYEQLKRQWDVKNPDATPEQRDAAINQISKDCGV